MLPALNSLKQGDEKKLQEVWQRLRRCDRVTLLRFAEFLATSSGPAASGELPRPEVLERPAEETVVKAIKRLTATYPMIDKDKLLPKTSDLMAAHVINGRSAKDVIDELESLFAEHYQQLKNEFEQNCS